MPYFYVDVVITKGTQRLIRAPTRDQAEQLTKFQVSREEPEATIEAKARMIPRSQIPDKTLFRIDQNADTASVCQDGDLREWGRIRSVRVAPDLQGRAWAKPT